MRAYRDDEENIYFNCNSDRQIWESYKRYCDELRLIVRTDGRIYTKAEAMLRFGMFDKSLAEVVLIPDIRSPRRNLFSLRLRAETQRIIADEVSKADRVIVRSA